MSDQQIPNFHDGLLVGILVKDKTATLLLTQVDGAEYQLELTGVRELQVDDFRAGNIILSLDLWSGSQADRADLSEDLKRLFPGPHVPAAPEAHGRHEDFISRTLAELAKGETTLLRLVPSYGAELVALFKSAEFQKL